MSIIRRATVRAAACITSPGRGRGPRTGRRLAIRWITERLDSGDILIFKVNICSREELVTHHLSLLPNNTLTLIGVLYLFLTQVNQVPLICFPARVVFVQEQTSDLCDSVYTDNFLDGSNSLSSDLSDAFRQTDFTDMTIVCDKREFHCHKFMLAARSEVFAAMLRHEFLEKQNSRFNSPPSVWEY